MKISFENADKVNGQLTIVVEEADYNEKVEKTLKDYRKKANIPGFRPGQAPLSLIKKQVGEQVKMDELNKLVGETIYSYLKDNNIQYTVLGRTTAFCKARGTRSRETRSLYLRLRHCRGSRN